MKNIKLILVLLLVCFNSYAQDPQLFENDWYLQTVFIDDIVYSPPNVEGEMEIGSISFFEGLDTIYINYCGSIEAIINYDSNDNIFTLEDFPGVLLGDCLSPENNAFSLIYSSVFFDQSLAINPFTYTINNDNDIAVLTIVNPNGGVAQYGNELLSNQDFDSSSFTLYPNPATHVITIESASQNSINRILIYDTLGRLVLEQKKLTNQIDISTLDSGLLFITIETDKGVFAKKIIKQ